MLFQRSNYEPPPTMVPLNNAVLDAAWQQALAFHRHGDAPNSPILFKDQIDAEGRLQAFSPLFCCRHTKKWFQPVCPQCGLALTLCRDDALLEQRGLPGYADSLERFLYCETCAKISPASPFFVPCKRSDLPDTVQDRQDLILQYKQLLATLPEEAALPCRGCPEVEACYGSSALAAERIETVAFFPFYMLMFPAPTHGAADFIRMISGGTDPGLPAGDSIGGPLGENRFFYQGEDRQFLEILYLKLTFLAQVAGCLMPDGHPERNQEFDFSLDSIGVDLVAPGAGLPAFWNFNIRILDSVGSFQASPFAPAQPEAPVLHFLAAVWFQTLLVNSQQKAEAVFAEIGKLAAEWKVDDENGDLATDLADPGGMFAAKQVYWEPSEKSIPQQWNSAWEQALRLGFQLVLAGLKAGASWDSRRFRESLESLRNTIKTEMFRVPVAEAFTGDRFPKSDRMVAVLSRVLDKWQAQATDAKEEETPEMPDEEATVVFTQTDTAAAEPTADAPQQEKTPPSEPFEPPIQSLPSDGWGDDIEETVVLSAPAAAPPDPQAWSTPQEAPGDQSQWEDDIEETVVLNASGLPPVPEKEATFEDADQTVVISPASVPPTQPSTDPDADLAATMIQGGDGQTPTSPSMSDWDTEATVVIGKTPTPPPAPDDDLESTIIQGGGAPQAAKMPNPDLYSNTPSQEGTDPSDAEATVVINTGGRPGPPVVSQEPVEDDDIMEQTIIIRSDIKKE
nr:hypothetical protein [uncultured Desulfosarcina sp.]